MFFRVNGSLDEPRLTAKEDASDVLVKEDKSRLTVSVSIHSAPSAITGGRVICLQPTRNPGSGPAYMRAGEKEFLDWRTELSCYCRVLVLSDDGLGCQ